MQNVHEPTSVGTQRTVGLLESERTMLQEPALRITRFVEDVRSELFVSDAKPTAWKIARNAAEDERLGLQLKNWRKRWGFQVFPTPPTDERFVEAVEIASERHCELTCRDRVVRLSGAAYTEIQERVSRWNESNDLRLRVVDTPAHVEDLCSIILETNHSHLWLDACGFWLALAILGPERALVVYDTFEAENVPGELIQRDRWRSEVLGPVGRKDDPNDDELLAAAQAICDMAPGITEVLESLRRATDRRWPGLID